tara:strand:- start:1911 stop:2798 length:888 start_codon:yes stop_codon:yes gene_type:complete
MAVKNHYVCCKSQNLTNIINLNNNNISSFDDYNSKYYNGYLNQIFSRDEFSVFHCTNCGHYQYNLDIDQNKINKMYKIHYDLKLLRKKKNQPPNNDDFKKKVLVRLQKIKNASGGRNKLLDFGAGEGLWSSLANKVGFNTTSYEPNSTRFETSKNSIFYNSWEDVKKNKYDVILCNQVLEHVIDPQKIIKQLREVSHNKTLLLCNVPNVSIYDFDELVSTWPYNGKKSHVLAPMQHLHGFTQKSFLYALKKEKFIVSLWSLPHFKLSIIKIIIALIFGKYVSKLSSTDFVFRLKD